MNTRRLPRTLVVALGLGGCGDDDGGMGGMTTTACLIAPLTESASDSISDSATGTDSATGQSTSSATDTDASDSSTFGPCLIAPPGSTSSGGDTETDTDTDTGTGDSTATDGSTSDAQLGDDHDAVVGRLLDRGVLPPDIAAKLRSR